MEQNKIISVKQSWYELLYFINRVLFPPAKVMFVIWTLSWVAAYTSNKMLPGAGELIAIIFGYIIYCGLADLIYLVFRKKYIKYKMKITEKHLNRIKSLMKELDPVRYEQQYGKEQEKGCECTDYSKRKVHTYFEEAARLCVDKNKGSIGMLQRYFKIGFNQAARIMDQLEEFGIVGPEEGTMPRKVLVDADMLEYMLSKKTFVPAAGISNINNNDTESERIGFYNNNYDYMTGVDFELFCADLLRKLGFVNVEPTKASGDHGADILAEKDGITYAIQCKCYSSNIGNAAVQQALAGKQYYQKDIAVVLTNQYFTTQAKEEAAKFGVKLWDRDKLNELLRDSELK